MSFRFEKFERKYNFQIPDTYRLLITELGDEYSIGNCEFYAADNFINNDLRLGGAMEASLFPFGGLENGDCFCFLKYGENPEEYYIVLWLSETYNYIILNSSFDNFIYNCLIQEYKVLLNPEEYMQEGNREEFEESIDKINTVSALFDFDLETIEKAKNEEQLDRLVLKRDPFAIQLLCMESIKQLECDPSEGKKCLLRAICFCPNYTANYYILGKYLMNIDKKEAIKLLFRGAMTSVSASGYSYWDEDYIGIPKNVLEEIFSILISNIDIIDDECKNSSYMKFIMQQKPYNAEFRLVLAQKLIEDNDYINAIKELNNVILLTEDLKLKIKILEMLIPLYNESGLVWAAGICRKDIKYIKGMK